MRPRRARAPSRPRRHPHLPHPAGQVAVRLSAFGRGDRRRPSPPPSPLRALRVPSAPGAWRVAARALVAAFAALTVFVFSTEAHAGSVGCWKGYWAVVSGDGSSNPGRVSDIPCDAPKPGWVFDLGHIRWVYPGDRFVDGRGNVRQIALPVPKLGDPGYTRPPVNQPVSSVYYVVPGHPNHRAVRGTDGYCYREWRERGQWHRSEPYTYRTSSGSVVWQARGELCRRAAWNAYYVSQLRPRIDPDGGTFPSGMPPSVPALQSAAVDRTTLTLTFTENLDGNSLPAPGAFHVTVNGKRRNVATGGVAISGKTVKLTLASAVAAGDTVKVRYTRPSNRPLLRLLGVAVKTFANRAVTNNTTADLWSATLTVGPELDGSGTMGCNSFLSDPSKTCGTRLTHDTFRYAGLDYKVVQMAVHGSTGEIFLRLDRGIPSSWTLHVDDHELHLANRTRVQHGGKSWGWHDGPSVSWTEGQQVSLRLVDTGVGLFESAAVDGKTLTMTLTGNLDGNSLPARNAFRVTVNGKRRNVAAGGVAISGKTVKLTLASAVTPTDTVKVRYTRPSSKPLSFLVGGAVATFTDRAVTNNTTADLWSATLTVNVSGQWQGCGDIVDNAGCSTGLTSNSFTHGATTYRIQSVYSTVVAGDVLLRYVYLGLDKAIPSSLTLSADDSKFRVADAALLTDGGKTAIWVDPGLNWSANQQVPLRLTTSTGATGVTISVADARATEAAGASVDFKVSLSGASANAVTVDYDTSDGSATAGADYTETRGTLTFAPGETSKTVSVPVLDDSHDERYESFTLLLYNPVGATIDDGSARGTIANADPAQRAWLARFGRTVAEQVIGAVDARMSAPRTTGNEVVLGGQRIAFDAPAGAGGARDAEAAAAERRLATWLRHADPDRRTGLRAGGAGDLEAGSRHALQDRGMTEHELLLGSSFSFAAGDARSGQYGLWGRGSVARFDGREGGLTVDGEVASAFLGADWSRERTTLGLILGHSIGDGGYGSESGRGTVSSTLTGLYPWVRRALGERISLWGVAGYGEGTLTVTPANADGTSQAALRTDLELTMGAVGLRGTVVQAPAEGGFELGVKTDAMGVRTRSASVPGLAGANAEVTRLRLGLEGSRPFRFEGGASLTPSVEVGVRQDGGDAETGFGVDVGGGIAWTDPQRGLSVDLRGRGLVSHDSKGFREAGLSGSLSWEPRSDNGRGPSLTLTQTMGGQASGGADALLRRGTLAGLAANDGGTEDGGLLSRRRLELRFGYGFGAFGDAFTSTPELGFGLSEAARDYRLGWRLSRAAGAGSLDLSLEATRREAANDNGAGYGAGAKPEHAVGLRFEALF